MNMDATNWTYCHYATGPLKAMIGQGLAYDTECNNPPPIRYWLTVLKDEYTEVFQEEFDHLPQVLDCINQRYGHWDFVDTSQAAASGCDSCSNNNK